jgi:hypothetical protein
MGKVRLFAVAACAVAVVGVGASAAVAGEVKGPPGAGNVRPKGVNPNASVCAYSGLNDFINGQNDRQTQTPKDAAPGSAAFGWAPDPTDPTFILTCNKNGPVGS